MGFRLIVNANVNAPENAVGNAVGNEETAPTGGTREGNGTS